MKTREALSIVLEAAGIRRDQWLSAAEDERTIDGDLSDCISELYEAEQDEAAEIADQLTVAIETIKRLRP